jgi:aminoglycoside phosphotransferase (APT) family kinase protein
MRNVAAMPGAIEAWLGSIGHPATVTGYQPMTGGFSRDMAKVDLVWVGGTSETLVMRGDPPAEVATLHSDRDTEWHLLSQLSAIETLSVPRARFYCGDPTVFDTKAMFMEFVPGGSLQGALDAGLDHVSTAQRFVDLMAAVANVEPHQVPALTCPSSWDDYLDGILARWSALATTHPEAQPILRYLAAWLAKRKPAPLPLRLQHADLQPGNVVAGADSWRIVDWEFARIGDPREDLGYYNAYSSAVPPNLAQADLEQFLARFRQQTGFSEDAVNPVTFGYFTVLSTVTSVEGLVQASAAMARGTRRGIPISFNTHLITVGTQGFLDAVTALEATVAVTEAQA